MVRRIWAHGHAPLPFVLAQAVIGAILVVYVGVAATGCDSGVDSAPGGPTPTATLDPTPRTFVSEEKGYSLTHPGNWRVEENSGEAGGVQADSFISDTADEGFAANVNIIREELPSRISSAEYIAATVAVLEEELGVTPKFGDGATVAGQPVFSFSYTAEVDARRYDVRQIALVVDGVGWVLTLSTATGYLDAHQDAFRMMYESFAPR
jgi:hypothetical protein